MTQAIFKKAQKAVKAAPQKAASATKKLQKSAPSPVKRVQSAAKKVLHGWLYSSTCSSALHCVGSQGALNTDVRPLTGCGPFYVHLAGWRRTPGSFAGAEGVAGEEGSVRA